MIAVVRAKLAIDVRALRLQGLQHRYEYAVVSWPFIRQDDRRRVSVPPSCAALRASRPDPLQKRRRVRLGFW